MSVAEMFVEIAFDYPTTVNGPPPLSRGGQVLQNLALLNFTLPFRNSGAPRHSPTTARIVHIHRLAAVFLHLFARNEKMQKNINFFRKRYCIFKKAVI